MSCHEHTGGRRVSEVALARPGLPVVVLAAGVLAADQVSFLLVGSAALWLRGVPVTVGDVDVAIEPSEPNLRRLHEALMRLAVRPDSSAAARTGTGSARQRGTLPWPTRRCSWRARPTPGRCGAGSRNDNDGRTQRRRPGRARHPRSARRAARLA